MNCILKLIIVTNFRTSEMNTLNFKDFKHRKGEKLLINSFFLRILSKLGPLLYAV